VGCANWFAGFEDFQLKQPVLFVVPKDPPGSAEQQKGFLKVWCSDLKTVGVDGGHWVHLESANATNEAIKEFLEKS
jgi:hypothetical protein